jgi:mRNA-degrading endonuclease RelE of RelBE toxin-antitoxin system
LHRVVLAKSAIKTLENAPEPIKMRIAGVLDALQQSFAPVGQFDVKRLRGMKGTFTIRIGGSRIIYEVRNGERRALDRASAISPDWTGLNESDPGMTIVQLLGFLGDELTYYQDKIAKEGYLGDKPKAATRARRKPP